MSYKKVEDVKLINGIGLRTEYENNSVSRHIFHEKRGEIPLTRINSIISPDTVYNMKDEFIIAKQFSFSYANKLMNSFLINKEYGGVMDIIPDVEGIVLNGEEQKYVFDDLEKIANGFNMIAESDLAFLDELDKFGYSESERNKIFFNYESIKNNSYESSAKINKVLDKIRTS